MTNRLCKYVALTVAVVVVLVLYSYHHTSYMYKCKELEPYDGAAAADRSYHGLYHTTEEGQTDDQDLVELAHSLKKSRQALSVQLNLQRKMQGQRDCMNSNKRTNENGGWCRNTSKEDGGDHMTDMHLVAVLANFLKGKKVGSFGDGPGAYKREILKTGLVPVYDAYDGAPFCEETSDGRVTFMDLTVPQYGIPMYDWIISLEVAEHIPAKSESIYIDNIMRHAREGIIISWAVPGQGGLAHINNKPLDYVVDLMKGHGFNLEKNESERIQNAASFEWLRQNTNVFVRSKKAAANRLELWHT